MTITGEKVWIRSCWESRSRGASFGFLAFRSQNRYGGNNPHPQSNKGVGWNDIEDGDHPHHQGCERVAPIDHWGSKSWLGWPWCRLWDCLGHTLNWQTCHHWCLRWRSTTLDSVQLIFTYLASVTIKIVCRCFKETQALTPNMQQQQVNFL